MKQACIVAVAFFAAISSYADWQGNLRGGLEVKVSIVIVDQFGAVVPNAYVVNHFIIHGKKTEQVPKLTDGNGRVEFKGRANIETIVSVSKEGYYKRVVRHKFMNRPYAELEKCAESGRWIPYDNEMRIEIGKKGDQIPVSGRRRKLGIPSGETKSFPLETELLEPFPLEKGAELKPPLKYVQPDKAAKAEKLHAIATNLVANASAYLGLHADVLKISANYPSFGRDWREILKKKDAIRRKGGKGDGDAYRFSLQTDDDGAGLLLCAKNIPDGEARSEYMFPLVAPESGYTNRLDFSFAGRGVGAETFILSPDDCILVRYYDNPVRIYRYAIINYLAFTRDDDGGGVVKMQYWPLPPRETRDLEFMPFDPTMLIQNRRKVESPEFLPATPTCAHPPKVIE